MKDEHRKSEQARAWRDYHDIKSIEQELYLKGGNNLYRFSLDKKYGKSTRDLIDKYK